MRRWVRTVLVVPGLLLGEVLCFGQSLVWHSPSPTASQAAELLKAICPGSIEGDPPSGCRPCPKYTSRYFLREDLQDLFKLGTVFYGSFTAPGAEEAVAGFWGCEDHATGFGGSIFLKKVSGTWVMVNYFQAWTIGACRIYHLRTGRDLLLCEGEYHNMGGGLQWISISSISRDQSPSERNVIEVIDTRPACDDHPVWGTIDKAELHDLNGDGMPDLTVWFSLGQGASFCDADTSKETVQKLKLDFLFQQDAESFVPTPSSKALIESHRAFFKTDN
jgi:hypothetical protein